MSEPIPDPDKFTARLIAFACAVLLIGLCARAIGTDSGTALVGYMLLTIPTATVMVYAATYRTHEEKR